MRVFILAPNFSTLGGIEVQLMALVIGLVERHVQLDFFVREPVRPDHPYWLKMRAAGARLHAPPRWFAAAVDWARRIQPNGMSMGLLAASPLLAAAAALDAAVRRRSWRRSWQGGRGRWRGWQSRHTNFDGMTWWMERAMDRVARVERPDIIDSHHSMLPTGITYGKRRGLPTIYTEYGAPDLTVLPGVWEPLKPAIDQADFIVGRSQASIAGLRRLFGISQPAEVVEPAVLETPPAGAALAAPVSGQPVRILYIGRLSPEKGIQFLLPAFKQLVQEDLPVHLELAGDGPLRQTLQQQVQADGLATRVTFTGLFDKVGPLLKRADIVAHPTLNDGRSISVLEAMCWSRPVVGSCIGGIPEIIDDEITGLIVPPAEPVALAGALRRLVRDAALRQKMGAAGRAKFLAGNYTQERMTAHTLEIYRRVLAERSSLAAASGAS